jgi:hypothetical protein
MYNEDTSAVVGTPNIVAYPSSGRIRVLRVGEMLEEPIGYL